MLAQNVTVMKHHVQQNILRLAFNWKQRW